MNRKTAPRRLRRKAKNPHAPATLDAIFEPRSVAVIGASRVPRSIGRELLGNLIQFGFNGPVFPVNPNADAVGSIPCYPTVESIPHEVDLAVIVVPAARVPDVARACGRKGVKGLVVISAGFKEVGGAAPSSRRS